MKYFLWLLFFLGVAKYFVLWRCIRRRYFVGVYRTTVHKAASRYWLLSWCRYRFEIEIPIPHWVGRIEKEKDA